MNTFEDELRTLMQSDQVEVPVDLEAVLDGGRESVRGRRMGWTVAGMATLAVVASIVTPLLIAQVIPAVPAPAGTPTVVSSSSPTPAPSLDGTAWIAERLHGEPLAPGRRPTLEFAEDRASGYDGCNGFGGLPHGYIQDGYALDLGSMMTTVAQCSRSGVMEQASAFGDALRATTNFGLNGGRLLLRDSTGTTVVEFTPFLPDGRTWRLDPSSGTWVRGGGVTLVIDGTTLSGNAGCGDFTATLTRNGSRWTITDLRNKPMSCPYESGHLSNNVLERLAKVTAGEIYAASPTLRLKIAGGKDLVFTTG